MNPFPRNTAEIEDQQEQEKQILEMLKANPDLLKKYQEELTKAQAPMDTQEYLKKVKEGTLEQSLDQQGGLVILPSKGLVLKLFDRHSGEKIFVNVVKHAGVDHPEERQLVDLENQAGLRIPMSMGRVREDSDKRGTPCKVVDVVMNDQIVEKADKSSEIFYFMGQIISNYLLEKYKIAVAEENIVKVNMKYKGNSVQIQRIRAKKSPKIQDVTAPPQNQQEKTSQQFEEEEKLLNELSGQTGKPEKRPQFRVFGVAEGEEREEYSLESRGKVQALELQFDLGLLIHSRGIHLEASERVVYLFVRGLYEICVRVPERIGEWGAVFSRGGRVLRVRGQVREEEKREQVVRSEKVDIAIESEMLDELV